MKKKRLLAWVMTLMMILSMFGGTTVGAFANSILDDNIESQRSDWVYDNLDMNSVYPVLTSVEAGEDTIETTLIDGVIQKGSKKTFDVIARDKDGKKINSTVTLNGENVVVNFNDENKTSYTLEFTKEGENIVIVTAGSATKQYTINYQKVAEGEVIGKAVFCIEGFTVGLGYIIEPTIVDIIEGENSAQLLDRVLKSQGLEYENIGSFDKGFYLSRIANIVNNPSSIIIPQVLKESLNSDGIECKQIEGYANKSLGEFDITDGSRWMFTINNVFPNVGYSDSFLGDGDVLRTQFTLAFGLDIAESSELGSYVPNYFDRVNRDELTTLIAKKGYGQINDSIKAVAEKVNPSQKEIDDAVTELKSLGKPTAIPIDKNKLMEYINSAEEFEITNSPNPNYPTFGTNNGEWTMLCLARGEYAGLDYNTRFTEKYIQTYIENFNRIVTETIENNSKGLLHSAKGTEYSRSILALSALGLDANNVASKYNFITPYADYNYIKRQGINGPIFALIALDTLGYEIPESNTVAIQNSKGKMIDFILGKEITKTDGTIGGWALSGKVPDPDITAMALQSLAPYYLDAQKFSNAGCTSSYNEFKEKVERGLKTLSVIQLDTGGYSSWGTQNSESIAQVIVALTAFGINPLTNNLDLPAIGENVSFVTKGGSYVGIHSNNVIDALLAFRDDKTGGFCHVKAGDDGGGGSGTGVNAMATDQALYALISYARYLDGENTLYDMTDVKVLGQISVIEPPSKVNYLEGEIFDNTGMKVSAIYKDGTSKEIIDYVIDQKSLDKTDKEIVIKYRGLEAKQEIHVKGSSEDDTLINAKKDAVDKITLAIGNLENYSIEKKDDLKYILDYAVEKINKAGTVDIINSVKKASIDFINKVKECNTFIKVKVGVYDYTAVTSEIVGASGDGIVLDNFEVIVHDGAPTSYLLEKAFYKNSIKVQGIENNYITKIGDLKSEAENYPQSGWMMSYNNDDFTNLGMSSLTLHDGDVIELHYSTENWGTDVGSYFDSKPEIKAFNLSGASGTITNKEGTEANPNLIDVTVPYGTNVKVLSAIVKSTLHEKYQVLDKNVLETQDYTSPVAFCLKTLGGVHKNFYNVSVKVAENNNTGGGGGSTGGGGGAGGGIVDNGSKPSVTVSKDNNSDKVASATIKGNETTKAGTTSVSVPSAQVSSAITEASKAAKDAGTAVKPEVNVNVAGDTTTKKVEANLPITAAKEIVKNSDIQLKITSPVGNVTLDNKALSVIVDNSAAKSIAISIEKTLIGNRPAYELNVVSDKNTTVSNFGKGQVTVSIPYTLSSGEISEGLVVKYVAKDGTKTDMPTTFDTKNKLVYFTTNHFSSYVIEYDATKASENINFSDVKANDWFKESVNALASKGILTGKTKATFAPQDKITRAEFVAVLARMSSQEMPSEKTTFSDVAENSWYGQYVAWAVNAGIAKGTNETAFTPNANITRQDMAVMITRYAQYMKKDITGTNEAIKFADEAQIASYAKDAVTSMQKAGIINGVKATDESYSFMPKNNATRAEAAKMIYQMVK